MNKLFSAGVVALGLIAAAPAQATVTYYTNVNTFDAALTSVKIEDFNDNTLVSGLSIVSTVGQINGNHFADQLAPETQTTRFNFSSAINGLGGFFDLSPGGAGVGIQWTIHLLSGGNEILSTQIPASYTGQFFGFTSTNAFDSILFTAGTQANGVETYKLDNLHFGAVPEPASMALFGLGLVGLALSRRKQA